MLTRRRFGAVSLGAIAAVSFAGTAEAFRVTKSDAEWRKIHTPAQYSVLREEGTERAGSSPHDREKRAGIFHHLITLPTYHTAALSTDNLAKEYFGESGMLGYVLGVQRKEIREGIACVKHQNMSGSDIGDAHKGYFSGDAALKASGEGNTMNQFS